jgi:hypothetical protein
MVKIFQTLAYWMYNFVLTASGYADYTGMYQNVQGKYGMTWGFVFMLGLSILFAAVYYFGVVSKLKNATSANYLTVFFLGMLAMLVVNAFVLPRITGFAGSVWTRNLLCYCLIDIVYYTVFYELWSLLFMPLSKDTGHHLLKL